MGNKDKLLVAARECLLATGYAQTTVRDLVAASGANQASINYHFGSKEKLLTGVLHDLNREWGELLLAALDRPTVSGASRGARQEALWGRIIDSIRSNRALWFVNFESLGSARHDESIRTMIAEGQGAARNSLARAFAGIDPEHADPRAVRLAGSHYYALLVGVAAQWLADPDQAPTAAQIVAADVGHDR
ncbi:TetR/AcrR family transcriptional regulator [Krasilnikoviella flava]|uniref:Transcriptional regulator, TetR family n=1 Tax=Krasilnikoviella flava TaxID=526729 RepID=A0A1T5KZY8_9MICO|nr:TetR/AcrR family transcriptional regulator [Krasilnikoviella flava]SKC69035.1 transcriptional regulator, TetR family [Krasilnikoviella flava]